MKLTETFVRKELGPFIRKHYGRRVKIDFLNKDCWGCDIDGIQLVSKAGIIGIAYGTELRELCRGYKVEFFDGGYIQITEKFIEQVFNSYPTSVINLASNLKEGKI